MNDDWRVENECQLSTALRRVLPEVLSVLSDHLSFYYALGMLSVRVNTTQNSKLS